MWTRATYKLNHYQFLLKKIVPLQPCQGWKVCTYSVSVST